MVTRKSQQMYKYECASTSEELYAITYCLDLIKLVRSLVVSTDFATGILLPQKR